MKKIALLLSVVLSLLISIQVPAQTTTASTEKMSVTDRLAKARAAKAQKWADKTTANGNATGAKADNNAAMRAGNQRTVQTGQGDEMGVSARKNSSATSPREQRAQPADYKVPVDKSQTGPNGEIIRTGARGAKYYINKNGHKTYLSSNL